MDTITQQLYYGDCTAGRTPHRQIDRSEREETIVEKILTSRETREAEYWAAAFFRAARDFEGFRHRVDHVLKYFNATYFSHQNLTKSEHRFDIFGTLPEKFVTDYSRNGFFLSDAQINRCLAGDTTPLFQSDLTKAYKACPHTSEEMQENIEIHEMIMKHHMTESCGIPVISNGQVGLLRLMSTCDPAKFRTSILANLKIVQAIGHCIGTVGSTKFKTKFHRLRNNNLFSISPQQVSLLRALQKDCTLNEAAEILGISISTANQHIAAAKKALKTQTTHGTLIAAEKAGLLKF